MENNIKVLVVEDAEIARKIAKIFLTELKLLVNLAENGQKALEMFKKTKYDLILMDIGLPDISGIEVTKEIRSLENGKSHVPIVILTASSDETYRQDCLKAVAIDGYILKPLTKENAKSIIEKLVPYSSY